MRKAFNRKIVPKGTKFGNLTLIDSTSFSTSKFGKKKSIWKLKCSCGKIVKMLANNVDRGLSTSCGCLRKKTEESTIKHFFREYRQGAKNRNYLFELTLSDFKNLIKKPCYYCKSDPPLRKYIYSEIPILANGIDRVDNSKGYNLKNCVSCCAVCNRMKNNLSLNEFMEKINAISNRNCGNDYNTRTTYVTEANVGDTSKVVLLCIYDLVEKFNLQKSEILALFKTLLNDHIDEIDEFDLKK